MTILCKLNLSDSQKSESVDIFSSNKFNNFQAADSTKLSSTVRTIGVLSAPANICAGAHKMCKSMGCN